MGNAVSSESLENYQAVIRTKSRAWIADAPAKYTGGTEMGPTPFEHLLGALAACINVIVFHYARQAHIELEKMWIDLTDDWVKVDHEEEYHVAVKIRVHGNFKDKDLDRLLTAADRCPVHRLLEKTAVFTTEIEQV